MAENSNTKYRAACWFVQYVGQSPREENSNSYL